MVNLITPMVNLITPVVSSDYHYDII
jgi:hypothetical protein